jgi:hypothetical protein
LALLIALGFLARAVLDSPSFLDYFFEQDSWDTFVFLGVPALVYMGILAALVPLLRLRFHGPPAKSFLAAVALSLLALVVGVTMFEATALYLRYLPHGTGRERHGSSLETFVFWAEVAFFALYALVLALAAGIGRALLSWRLAGATVAATAVFMLLSFPGVEFLNACDIGEPLLYTSYVEC